MAALVKCFRYRRRERLPPHRGAFCETNAVAFHKAGASDIQQLRSLIGM